MRGGGRGRASLLGGQDGKRATMAATHNKPIRFTCGKPRRHYVVPTWRARVRVRFWFFMSCRLASINFRHLVGEEKICTR